MLIQSLKTEQFIYDNLAKLAIINKLCFKLKQILMFSQQQNSLFTIIVKTNKGSFQIILSQAPGQDSSSPLGEGWTHCPEPDTSPKGAVLKVLRHFFHGIAVKPVKPCVISGSDVSALLNTILKTNNAAPFLPTENCKCI